MKAGGSTTEALRAKSLGRDRQYPALALVWPERLLANGSQSCRIDVFDLVKRQTETGDVRSSKAALLYLLLYSNASR